MVDTPKHPVLPPASPNFKQTLAHIFRAHHMDFKKALRQKDILSISTNKKDVPIIQVQRTGLRECGYDIMAISLINRSKTRKSTQTFHFYNTANSWFIRDLHERIELENGYTTNDIIANSCVTIGWTPQGLEKLEQKKITKDRHNDELLERRIFGINRFISKVGYENRSELHSRKPEHKRQSTLISYIEDGTCYQAPKVDASKRILCEPI